MIWAQRLTYFFLNRYDQVTQERVFWYAFIRQVHPDAVSCWLHCICCEYVTDI